jgi:RHS repeat-associated protein
MQPFLFCPLSSGSGGAAAITSSFTYNKRLQPLTMSATAPSQTVFSIGYDFHLGNGNNGNVFGITNYKDQNRNQTFTYDALNRVISAQNAGTDCTAKVLQNKSEYWGNNYGYDAWGNLLQKTITKCGAENLSVTADAHNWLHASGTDYQYDAAGNMTYDATASLNYTFDQENRLTGAAGYTYTYDGDGNRVRKSNGNLAANGTLYWYMTPGVVAESDLAGTLKSEYVFFDGERVARRDGATGTGGVFYYFSDHLKTASVITDSAGVIKAESDYYPWGGELQFVNNDSNDYKFTGKKRDLETGLDYFGARYYSNGLGRWTTPDWAAKATAVPYAEFSDPQSLNLYSYVRNVPTVGYDSDGHQDVQTLRQAAPAVAPAAAACAAATPCLAAAITVGVVAIPGVYVINNMNDSINMADAFNPPYVEVPATTSTNTQTTVPATTSTSTQTTVPGTTATNAQTSAPASTSQKGTVNTSPATAKNTPRSDLPRDKAGNYTPHPNAQGPHSTIGTRVGKDGVPYRQGATFDEKGNFKGRTDVTDHGRGDHTDPHFHPATGPASVGPAEPIPND